jgi:hypothetical protein
MEQASMNLFYGRDVMDALCIVQDEDAAEHPSCSSHGSPRNSKGKTNSESCCG